MGQARHTEDECADEHEARVYLNIKVSALAWLDEAEADDLCESCWQDQHKPGNGHGF